MFKGSPSPLPGADLGRTVDQLWSPNLVSSGFCYGKPQGAKKHQWEASLKREQKENVCGCPLNLVACLLSESTATLPKINSSSSILPEKHTHARTHERSWVLKKPREYKVLWCKGFASLSAVYKWSALDLGSVFWDFLTVFLVLMCLRLCEARGVGGRVCLIN